LALNNNPIPAQCQDIIPFGAEIPLPKGKFWSSRATTALGLRDRNNPAVSSPGSTGHPVRRVLSSFEPKSVSSAINADRF
jgi:hypothetical protein